jgi:hypothetical protein
MASKNRSRLVGPGATPQCKSANPSDCDPRPSGTRQHPHGVSECSTRVDEILLQAAAEVRHRERIGVSVTNSDASKCLDRPGVCFSNWPARARWKVCWLLGLDWKGLATSSLPSPQ